MNPIDYKFSKLGSFTSHDPTSALKINVSMWVTAHVPLP